MTQKPEVSVYQLAIDPVEKVLPRLLEKIVDGGLRALVLTDTVEKAQEFNTVLWTFSTPAFLPHGIEGGPDNPDDCAIWISLEADNKNDATVLVLTGGRQAQDFSGYRRYVDIFDGNDPQAMRAFQDRCQAYLANGLSIVQWKQMPKGFWEKGELRGG